MRAVLEQRVSLQVEADPWNSRHDWRLLRHGGQRWRSFLTAAQRRPNEWRDTGLFRKCRERLRHGRIPWQCGQRRWRDHWHPGQRGCLLRHRWQRRRGLLTAAQRRPNEWRDTGQLRNSWERLRHGRIPWQCGQCWSSGSACKWSDPWNSRHDWRLLRHGGQRWRSFLTAAQRRPNEWRDTGLFRKCRERLRHGRIPWQCGQRRWRDHWHPGQRGCLLRHRWQRWRSFLTAAQRRPNEWRDTGQLRNSWGAFAARADPLAVRAAPVAR